MRTIHTDEIIKNIKEMCIEANLSLTEDMKCRFKNATESEKSPLGKQILNQLQDNMESDLLLQFPYFLAIDFKSIAGKYGNCSSRSDSNLSGYRNGNRISKYRTGCSY